MPVSRRQPCQRCNDTGYLGEIACLCDARPFRPGPPWRPRPLTDNEAAFCRRLAEQAAVRNAAREATPVRHVVDISDPQVPVDPQILVDRALAMAVRAREERLHG